MLPARSLWVAWILVAALSLLRGQPGRLEPGNLLQNGSFEDGPNPGSFITLSAGSTDIPGWKVTRGSVDYIGSYWTASQGARSIDLDGSPGAGTIQTSFPTTPGLRYQVSFDLSGNSQCDAAVKQVMVVVDYVAWTFSFDTDGQPPGSRWSRESLSFVARDRSTALEFRSPDDDSAQCGAILDNVAAAAVGAAAPNFRMMSGAWLDSDGKTHLAEQSGAALSWTVENMGTFRGELHGRDFQMILQAGTGINSRSIAFDRIHGTLSLDGLTVQTSEYLQGKLVAETTLVRLSTSAQDKPAKVWIQVEKPSTLSGQPIHAQVVVKTRDGVAVPADRDYQVELKVDDQAVKPGVLSSSHVVVQTGRPSAPFTITTNRPGETRISAHSDPPLAATPRSVYACGSGVIRAVDLSSGENQGPADGRTPIGFALKLTDGNGHLTTDLKSNTISIQRKGVGVVDRDSVELPGDQCIAELTIESAQPGSATVLANHGARSASGDFFFSLPLSVLLFVGVTLGALGGELIRLSADYSRRHRWGTQRVAMDALAAILAGVAVFLAYYYGLLQIAPRLTGGMGLGFLLGLIGGYLGPAAMSHISGMAVPGAEKPAEKARGKSAGPSG